MHGSGPMKTQWLRAAAPPRWRRPPLLLLARRRRPCRTAAVPRQQQWQQQPEEADAAHTCPPLIRPISTTASTASPSLSSPSSSSSSYSAPPFSAGDYYTVNKNNNNDDSSSSSSRATAAAAAANDPFGRRRQPQLPDLPRRHLQHLPSPPPERALHSAKLAALHARLALPQKLPLPTLARALVDASADAHAAFNNAALAQLGNAVAAYHATEHLLCHYPRLPTPVLLSALYAYCGPPSLAALVAEWGVEAAAEPGGEVDPGLLQLRRLAPPHDLASPSPSAQATILPPPPYPTPPPPFTAPPASHNTQQPQQPGQGANRPNAHQAHWRRGISSRIVYDDEFGDLIDPYHHHHPLNNTNTAHDAQDTATTTTTTTTTTGNASAGAGAGAPTTLERAQTNFARAVVGALALHAGGAAARAFVRAHMLARHVPLRSLFAFREPTRDLSRLCAREGFAAPVARIVSETGRRSRHPVFVVGVYSGADKLGEAAGASLHEARTRAAAAALRAWYLYSPLRVAVPSDAEYPGAAVAGVEDATAETAAEAAAGPAAGAGGGAGEWRPAMIDGGEVIV